MLTITEQAMEEIGVDQWQGACDHVDRVVEKAKVTDHYMDEQLEEFVINLADSCSDDSGDDSDVAEM